MRKCHINQKILCVKRVEFCFEGIPVDEHENSCPANLSTWWHKVKCYERVQA